MFTAVIDPQSARVTDHCSVNAQQNVQETEKKRCVREIVTLIIISFAELFIYFFLSDSMVILRNENCFENNAHVVSKSRIHA